MRIFCTWGVQFSCCVDVYHCDLVVKLESLFAKMARALRNFLPLFDRILVERNLPELKTKGGIMIPEKSQGRVQEAVVVAVGKGAANEKGEVTPVSVKVGDKVLLPEYGGTKLVLDEKEYFLIRDGDLLGKFEAQ